MYLCTSASFMRNADGSMWVGVLTFSLLIVCFFQAEDGIRGVAVTGVQTCALPILSFNECGRVTDTEESPVHPEGEGLCSSVPESRT